MKVIQFPLTKIIISFILGILVSFYLNLPLYIITGLLIISITSLILNYFGRREAFNKNPYFVFLSISTSFLLGSLNLINHTETNDKTNYIHNKTIFTFPQNLSLEVQEKIKSTVNYERFIAEIKTIEHKQQTGKIILNIPKNTLKTPLITGSQLRTTGLLIKNKNSLNPFQFDYSSYLSNKQIYAQLYLDEKQTSIGLTLNKNIWYYISKIRDRIVQNLSISGFRSRELNVAKALIMGQRQDLSPDIIQDYQYAGAIHILSVSGLHIGLILLFMNFILKPIPNTKYGSFIKLFLTLSTLVLFALIAGLSPSVVRSVVMFSFVAIGLYLRKTVNFYYTLLVSIFLILLIQPYYLFEIGFQLSYLALFFIFWSQPLLSSLWKPKSKILQYIWGILTVSIAAQLGTLPICLFYFHQFPGLFFITNLAIIPLLSFMMALGLLVMILASGGIDLFFLSKPLEFSIFILNKIISYIASIEDFVIKEIPFNSTLLLICYLFIVITISWIKKPTYVKLTLVLLTIIGFQSILIFKKQEIQNQQEWVLFNIKKSTLIAERNGNKVHVYSHDTNLNELSENKIVSSYLLGNFSHLSGKNPLTHFSFFKGKKILLVDSTGLFPNKTKPEIVILTQSTKINVDRMLQTLKPRLVIADASNYSSVIRHWKKSCLKQKIPFHATAEKGFYKLN